MEYEPARRAGPDTTATARHEIEQHDPPQIYVASLADYNAGSLHGAWIDATVDLEEISDRVERMLATSPTTPRAEDYAIHDFEGFGAYRPDEHDAIEWIQQVAADSTTEPLVVSAGLGGRVVISVQILGSKIHTPCSCSTVLMSPPSSRSRASASVSMVT